VIWRAIQSAVGLFVTPIPIPGLPSPVAAKARPMPTNQRLRANDLNGLQYRRKPAVQLDEKQPVAVRQPNPSATGTSAKSSAPRPIITIVLEHICT
jgi:hypothetical protein